MFIKIKGLYIKRYHKGAKRHIPKWGTAFAKESTEKGKSGVDVAPTNPKETDLWVQGQLGKRLEWVLSRRRKADGQHRSENRPFYWSAENCKRAPWPCLQRQMLRCLSMPSAGSSGNNGHRCERRPRAAPLAMLTRLSAPGPRAPPHKVTSTCNLWVWHYLEIVITGVIELGCHTGGRRVGPNLTMVSLQEWDLDTETERHRERTPCRDGAEPGVTRLQAKGHRDGQQAPEAGRDKEGFFPTALESTAMSSPWFQISGSRTLKECISVFQPPCQCCFVTGWRTPSTLHS